MNSLIKVDNLTIYYGNNNQALENVNIEINENDFIGIVGQNGSGKSTFLKAVLGLIPLTKGEITFLGEKRNIGMKKLRIGYVPQYSQMNASFPINVMEAVAISTFGKGLHPFKYL